MEQRYVWTETKKKLAVGIQFVAQQCGQANDWQERVWRLVGMILGASTEEAILIR